MLKILTIFYNLQGAMQFLFFVTIIEEILFVQPFNVPFNFFRAKFHIFIDLSVDAVKMEIIIVLNLKRY